MKDSAHPEDQLDRHDRRIIAVLEKDGRMPVTELARRVGLSKSPCQVRLKRLIDEGYILGFKAVLDMAKIGREHVAFTEVKLSDTTEKALAAFNAAVKQIPEVEQCHMIAGPFDFLLKVRTRDIRGEAVPTAGSVCRLEEVKGRALRRCPLVFLDKAQRQKSNY